MLLKLTRILHKTCIHLNVSSQMYLRCMKKALPFQRLQKVLWYTRLQSAFSKKLLQWVRHNFKAASATFRSHSHCFFDSEVVIASMFLKAVCPCLFQLLCLHPKPSESMIQKYSYRNLFFSLKAQDQMVISILRNSFLKQK